MRRTRRISYLRMGWAWLHQSDSDDDGRTGAPRRICLLRCVRKTLNSPDSITSRGMQSVRVRQTSVRELALRAMIAEDALSRHRRRLGAVAYTELRVEAPELRLDGVLTDVEMATQFAIRHARGQKGQELALTFGQADVPARPSQRF